MYSSSVQLLRVKTILRTREGLRTLCCSIFYENSDSRTAYKWQYSVFTENNRYFLPVLHEFFARVFFCSYVIGSSCSRGTDLRLKAKLEGSRGPPTGGPLTGGAGRNVGPRRPSVARRPSGCEGHWMDIKFASRTINLHLFQSL